MTIAGFEKLTLLDYPEHTACIVFVCGCNMRCPFCHNSNILERNDSTQLIDEQEILDYLRKRKNVLEGVVITGGEPTLQKDLEQFIVKIKQLGYLVKLDTNGTMPSVLKSLLSKNLVDYVAMDIKNSFEEYSKTCGVNVNIDDIKKSMNIIKTLAKDYEFRTTFVSPLFTENSVESMATEIGECDRYFMQNFVDSQAVLNKNLTSIDKNVMKTYKQILDSKGINATIR